MSSSSTAADACWRRSCPAGRFFLKMHGLGNHFVIVDARDRPFSPSTPDIVRICDPRTGVGADQLVVVEPPSAAGRAAAATAFMRLYNVDGRQVEACGNATRCVAWLLMEESGADAVGIETLAGVLECRRAGERFVRCDMGQIRTDWRSVPLARETDTLHVAIGAGPLEDGVALSIGNPHIVYFVDDLDAVDLAGLAPGIQQNGLFPEQVNVGVAQLVDPDRLRLVVYERGAGLTTACGSGACVAAYAAIARDLTASRHIRVLLPGGPVDVEIGPDGRAIMTGPVAYCFSGRLPA